MNLFRGRKTPDYLAACEYWVYLRNPKMPPQNAVMLRLQSPPAEDSLSPVDPSEAMLLSDIRLYVALVLRSKNPHLFRPDLFESHIEPTAEILEELAAAQGLAKVRYVSEEPLADDRHLRFVPRLADALASMCASRVVFDSVAERLESAEHFHAEILRYDPIDVPDFHLRVVWMPDECGGRAATRGLAKIGLPELETPVTRGDHQAIVCEVLGLAAEWLWRERRVEREVRLMCYDDTFMVHIDPGRKSPLKARVMRVTES